MSRSYLYHIIKQGLRDTFFIWKQELKNIFHDSGVIIFFFVVPFAYPILYGLIYNPEIVHEVPMVVVDDSRTSISREFAEKIDGSADVKVVSWCANMEEAKKMLDKKEAYGILYIPSPFSKDLHTGKQTLVSLYCDMSSMLYYKALLLSATEVSLDMGTEIQISHMDGTTAKMEEITTKPVTYNAISMYNAQNGFASFLLPAILVLIIQQTLLLGIGMLSGTAREKNRFRSLIPVNRQYDGTLRVVFGKSLAYFIIYTLVCFWALLIVPHLFVLPQIGHLGIIILFVLPYLLACIFFSMVISCLITGRETPMLIFVFTSVPLLFISGISWPASAVPEFWKWIGNIFPSTPGIQGFVKLNSMGASLTDVRVEYSILWLQTGIYFILTCLLYRYQLIRSKRIISISYRLLKRRKNFFKSIN